MPNILDLFRGKTTTLAEQPVTTGELVHVTGSEVEPVPPKNENLIDFQVTLYDKWLADWLKHGNPIHYGYWAPAYNNTIDKVIIEYNRPKNVANRLAEWLDNEREKGIAWQMEMKSHATVSRLTWQRIDDAIKNL